MNSIILNPNLLYTAYCNGYFPMADPEDNQIYWHNPDFRAVFPLNEIKPKKDVRKSIRDFGFTFDINKNFKYIIMRCADRDDCWISDEIIDAYIDFHKLGFAHSVETYCNGVLAGGLYGVAIGSAFFGESMFSMVTNASKAAFYFLVKLLKSNNFTLLDSQYINPHTASLGAVEIPRREYMLLLQKAIADQCKFKLPDDRNEKQN